MRIGIGYDIHRFQEGRPLILGGVTLRGETGLGGHSDADVLLHAVIDALLGAAGLGDIGQRYPPDDPAYAGADSRRLLAEVRTAVEEAGDRLGNGGAPPLAGRPKPGAPPAAGGGGAPPRGPPAPAPPCAAPVLSPRAAGGGRRGRQQRIPVPTQARGGRPVGLLQSIKGDIQAAKDRDPAAHPPL